MNTTSFLQNAACAFLMFHFIVSFIGIWVSIFFHWGDKEELKKIPRGVIKANAFILPFTLFLAAMFAFDMGVK